MSALQVLTARRQLTAGWAYPDGTTVTVALLQFESDQAAAEFFSAYSNEAAATVGLARTAEVPGVNSAKAFVQPGLDPKGRQLQQAVAYRDDIAFLITETRRQPTTLAHLHTLTLDQYERLPSRG